MIILTTFFMTPRNWFHFKITEEINSLEGLFRSLGKVMTTSNFMILDLLSAHCYDTLFFSGLAISINKDV